MAAKVDEDDDRPWLSVAVVAWSSLLVGCALAQLNALTGDHSAIGALRLSTMQVSACTAALYGSAGACAIIANKPLDRLGRKTTLLWANALFIGGGLCTCFDNFALICVGRIVIGGGCGINLVAVPTLLAEMAPPEVRGSMGVVHIMYLNGGICLSSFVA